jgi:hypothetical protein
LEGLGLNSREKVLGEIWHLAHITKNFYWSQSIKIGSKPLLFLGKISSEKLNSAGGKCPENEGSLPVLND